MSRTRNRNTLSQVANSPIRLTAVNTTDKSWYCRAGAFTVPAFSTEIRDLTLISYGKTGEVSTITDNPGPYTTAWKPYRNVSHAKTVYSLEAEPFSMNWDIPYPTALFPQGKVTMKAEGSVSDGHWGSMLNAGPFLVPDDVLRARAIGAMQTKMPAGYDVPLFLGELKDFAEIFKNFGNFFLRLQPPGMHSTEEMTRQAWKKLRQVSVPWGPNAPSGALRRAEATVAKATGIDLAWKFMVKPTIDGIYSMNRVYRNLETSYAKRTANPYRVVRGHASVSANKSYPINLGSYYVSGKADYEAVKDCNTWALIKYDYSGYSPFNHLLNEFALNLRLDTAYQLMPLSFILEWFVGVGKWLRQFDGGPVITPFTVLTSGTSYKTVTKSKTSLTPFKGSNINGHTWEVPAQSYVTLNKGRMEQSNYSRVAGPVNFDHAMIRPVEYSFPNLSQIGSLVEIIYLMVR